MIESIRNYMCSCPLLKDGCFLRVDFLGNEPTEYVIETVPTNRIIKRYVDGGSLREYLFIFASREYYSSDVLQNLENSGFYEDFAEWIESQNAKGIYPDMGRGKSACGIEALSNGYMFDATENEARYQIQCRIIYYQKG